MNYNTNSSSPALQEQSDSRRRTLRSHRNRAEEGSESDTEAAAAAANVSDRQFLRHRSTRPPTGPSSTEITAVLSSTQPSTAQPLAAPTDSTNAEPTLFSEPSTRGRPQTQIFVGNFRSAGGIDSAVGSPSRGDLSPRRRVFDNTSAFELSLNQVDVSLALENSLLENNTTQNYHNDFLRRSQQCPQIAASSAHTETSTADLDPLVVARDCSDNHSSDHRGSAAALERLKATPENHISQALLTMSGSSKRTKDKHETTDGRDLINALKRQGAVTAMLYHNTVPDPEANDIWPNFRSTAKLPARYSLLDMTRDVSQRHNPNERQPKLSQTRYGLRGQTNVTEAPANASAKGRPLWQLPVELVEQIIEYLNRDDVKSLRLVSRELNEYTSQAVFKTVVVPFNTEIYGMLGQEPNPDRKGKKRAKISRPDYWWKNSNGDEVYKGHGLDVFRGFGRHILKYGMSFEVTEDSLSTPPLKSVTEQKTSFWGNYEWPFEEYRRFDAVAGLECAADETPRMKTAFSELTRVKELALSIDSGLGWIHGPDRSIRARILQKPPNVFGARQNVPDRRTQAQHELWDHVQTMHANTGDDIRTASLYRLEGTRSLTEAQEACLLFPVQPTMPFLEPHIMHEAVPHDATDSVLPASLEDPELLDRFILGPPSTNAGVLFTSTTLQHSDAGQLMSPIVPATLTKAQKEWLLETEWAQRAFMSSYMLSVIDNPVNFHPIHTLNISSLSDRYISMLNRPDFWNALTNLTDVTLMVIPGWRDVHKDEAGFVDTPKVDPTGRIDAICELLRTQVALRPKITKLTVGFAAGGEHAEGLHARNKLLMPAPILPLTVRMHADPSFAPTETATVQDAKLLQKALLCFPYLEELTVRNCWITPSALLQFVKVHDKYSLKHLTLDSVSLTAMLRPAANAQAPPAGQQGIPQNPIAPPNMAGVLWHLTNNQVGGNGVGQAQGLHLPANYQLLNLYIQSLIVQLQQLQPNAGGMQHQQHITALQTQLQQQLQTAQAPNQQQAQGPTLPLVQNPVQQNQQVQQQLNFAQMMHLNNLATQVNMIQQQIIAGQVAPLPLPHDTTSGHTDSLLQMLPREGSWMDIIDQVSPGTNLSDFGSDHSQADGKRTTSLMSIDFISCGYAKLPHLQTPSVDQSAIETGNGWAAALRNPIFTKRYNALTPAMLSSKWPYLGEIVQEVCLTELAALDAGWNLRHGWVDVEAAKAAEFDGLLSGGTGRFTGKVQRSDRVSTDGSSAG